MCLRDEFGRQSSGRCCFRGEVEDTHGSARRICSPLTSRMSRRTPCAAGCCGPKLTGRVRCKGVCQPVISVGLDDGATEAVPVKCRILRSVADPCLAAAALSSVFG